MSAFYLKYRPQNIKELDLIDIRERLEDVLASKNIPHAFLFSGPKGLGKTSAARIVAKAINCIAKTKTKPCNKCDICLSITKGTSLDFIEIDAASNRGIDDIRQLKDSIKLVPSRAKKKFYVIDEVHMLTIEAFNALLKTLEEPPDHVIFILCTTASYKLPDTIISRCQHFEFKQANINEIVRSLRRIKIGEKLKIDDKVLEKIASRSDSSFRDATKYLEMLVAIYGKNISFKKTLEFFGQEGVLVKDFLKILAAKDTNSALMWLTKAITNGLDLTNFTITILETLRQILLSKYGIGIKIDDYGLETDDIKKLCQLFSQAGNEVKFSLVPSLPLELAIIEWGMDKTADNLKPTFAPPSPKWLRRPSKASHFAEATRDKPAGGLKAKSNELEVNRQNINSDLASQWPEVLRQVKEDNHSIEALLKATRPINLDGDILKVEVFYKFHKNKLEHKRCVDIIEKRLKEVFLKPIKIKFILGTKRG